MRGLGLLNWYTAWDLSGVSQANTLLHMVDALQRLPEPERMLLHLPREGGRFVWPDGWFDRPGVEPLYVGANDGFRTVEPFELDEVQPILPKRGRLLFEYLLNGRYLHGTQLMLQMWAARSKWRWTPEMSLLTWYTESTIDPRLVGLRTRAAQALMAAAASMGSMIVMNEYDRIEALGMLEPLIPEHDWERVARRTYVVNAAADFDVIDRRRPEYEAERKARREAGRWTLYQGGSSEKKRLWREMVTIVGDLNSARMPEAHAVMKTQVPDADTWLKQQVAGVTKDERDRLEAIPESAFSIASGVGHVRYVDSLGEGDVLWMAPDYEGTGLAYMEAIRSGMVPVVIDSVWARTRLPEKYPLVVDLKDAPGAVEFALRNAPALWKEWGDRLLAALDPYAPDAVVAKYREVVAEATAFTRLKNMEGVRLVQPAYGVLESYLDECKPAEVTDAKWLKAEMSEHARHALKPKKNPYTGYEREAGAPVDFGYVSEMTLWWMLRALGYRDRCDRPGLSMERK